MDVSRERVSIVGSIGGHRRSSFQSVGVSGHLIIRESLLVRLKLGLSFVFLHIFVYSQTPKSLYCRSQFNYSSITSQLLDNLNVTFWLAVNLAGPGTSQPRSIQPLLNSALG